MPSFTLCKPEVLLACVIGHENVSLHWRGVGHGVEDSLVLLIHTIHGCDLEITFCDLCLRLSIDAVEIQVSVSIHLTCEEEVLSIFEKPPVVVDLYEVFILLFVHPLAAAGLCIG